MTHGDAAAWRGVRRRSAGVWSWLALAVVTASAACGGETPPQGPPGGFATPVEILTLVERPVEQASEYVGTVRSLRSTTVQSQAEGFLTRIHVASGDRVTPGQVLFEIDAGPQQAVVASLESIRAAREADLALARQQADRARRLLDAGAMSQQEFDQAQTLVQTAEAQLRAVAEQIRQQRSELAYYRVTASTSGVIGDVPARVGDRVTRSTPLTTIEDNSRLELHLNVPVGEAPRLKTGLLVRLLDDTGAEMGAERVSFVSPSADQATQTVLVKAPIGGTLAGRVRSDQFVRARVVWSTAPALTVPLAAVTRISGQYFVFIAEPGEGGGLVARQRPVQVGDLVDNDYLVRGGLSAGDRVIVAGVQKIGEGAPVAAGPAGGGR